MARVALAQEPIWGAKAPAPSSAAASGAASVAYTLVRSQEQKVAEQKARRDEKEAALEGAEEGARQELEDALAATDAERLEMQAELDRLRAEAARLGATEISCTLHEQAQSCRFSFENDMRQASELLSSSSVVDTPRDLRTPRGATPSSSHSPRVPFSPRPVSVATPREGASHEVSRASTSGMSGFSSTSPRRRLSPLDGDRPLTQGSFEAAQTALQQQQMSRPMSLASAHTRVPSTSMLQRVPRIADQPGLPDYWHGGLPRATPHGCFSSMPYHVEEEYDDGTLTEPIEPGKARRERLANLTDPRQIAKEDYAPFSAQSSLFGMPPRTRTPRTPMEPPHTPRRRARLEALARPTRLAETPQTMRARVVANHWHVGGGGGGHGGGRRGLSPRTSSVSWRATTV